MNEIYFLKNVYNTEAILYVRYQRYGGKVKERFLIQIPLISEHLFYVYILLGRIQEA